MMWSDIPISRPYVDQELIEDIKQRESIWEKGIAAFLRDRTISAREKRQAELLDLADVSPSFVVKSFQDKKGLTGDERELMFAAMKEPGRCVALPAWYKRCLGGTHPRFKNIKQAEKAASRAAQRLWNRGIARLFKVDGITHIILDEERILNIVKKDVAERTGGHGNIYLIGGGCKIQTLSNDATSGCPKNDPTELPKKCGMNRLAAIRVCTGERILDDEAKTDISANFLWYIGDINAKIITFLDPATGDLLGAEYSTRFNDPSKAVANMQQFEDVMEQSFYVGRSAVFLTLTSDPNLPDEQKAALKAERLEKVEKALKQPNLTPKQYSGLIRKYYTLVGPDKEIEDLQARNVRTDEQEKRLKKLLDQRAAEPAIRMKLASCKTRRQKAKYINQLSMMNRWEHPHDPEGHRNLWETNRSFGKAWNGFMSFLKKRLGRRPQYVAAFEYTETGLLHVHALIFTDSLPNTDEISTEWRRLGQGSIAYQYRLRQHKTTDPRTGEPIWEWRWVSSSSRPADSKGMSGTDYLKKYLKKSALAMMDDYRSPADTQSLYWTFNKRFWTCSRQLQDAAREVRARKDESFVHSGTVSRFAFGGVISSELAESFEIPMIYRKGSFRNRGASASGGGE